MKGPCGQEDCDCGSTIEELEGKVTDWKESESVMRGWLTRTIKQRDDTTKALEGVEVRDDRDGLWILFDNGRQKCAYNTGSPGPIVRKAILGWYRQARAAINKVKGLP